ncbi:hypothetical protein LXL04_013363 [Taraxacum kok-saghyz]
MVRVKVVSESEESALNSTNSVPLSNFRVVVRYVECHRNYACREGGHRVDGCQEYIPNQEDVADPPELLCANCGCHRNFHRRVVVTEVIGNGIWKDVIKAIYGEDGGFDRQLNSGMRGTVWGNIIRIKDNLQEVGINLDNILYEADTGANTTGAGWQWGLNGQLDFTTSSLRKLVDGKTLVDFRLPRWWTSTVPCKINVFIWRACLGRLPTRYNLVKRGISIPALTCPWCNRCDETEQHLFFECSTSKDLQAHLFSWWAPACLPAGTPQVKDILQNNAIMNSAKSEVARRAFLWILWIYRNEAIFKGKVKSNLQLVTEFNIAGISPLCPLCSTQEETEEHLFLRCSTTRVIMAKLKDWWKDLPDLDTVGNIDCLLNLFNGHKEGQRYQVLIRAFMWGIWSLRNEINFRGKVCIPTIVASDIRAQTTLWLKCRSKL